MSGGHMGMGKMGDKMPQKGDMMGKDKSMPMGMGGSNLLSSQKSGGGVPTQLNWKQRREMMTEEDFSDRFDELFALNLIEVDEDFYDEELYFRDPDALTNQFVNLEDNNLQQIHALQSLEQNLEEEKHYHDMVEK